MNIKKILINTIIYALSLSIILYLFGSKEYILSHPLRYAGMLLLFGVGFFGISVWKSRRKQR